jgi:Na+-transporting methylmalonyl-CoA/oxaloacetate decarboxylase gamma subunit
MNNLGWGLQITALGMGLVFALLALLWLLLTLVLKFDRPAVVAAPAVEAAAPLVDTAMLAAIGIAVLRHRGAAQEPEVRRHSPGSLLYASRWVATGRVRQNHSWHRNRGR